jgi:membrane protein implicated in regulation of membrane protease activity
MYIVAIAWIYVTLLMALTETNVTAGILTFALYGLLPLALLLWLFGSPIRRRRRRQEDEAN